MNYFGLTDKGKSRTENQDTFAIKPVIAKDLLICCVCDGVGGQNSGSVASELAKRSFTEYALAKLTSRVNRNPDIREVIGSACSEANSVVFHYSQFTEEYQGMGSTLVGCILFNNGKTCIVNVGDSRAYHISPRSGRIRQVTNDHSLVEMYVRAGIITREQAKTHKQKNIITRSIGGEPSAEADFFELTLKRGEALLLCSDGVSNLVNDEELLHYAKTFPDPEQFCIRVKDLVYERGAGDNLTVLMVVK